MDPRLQRIMASTPVGMSGPGAPLNNREFFRYGKRRPVPMGGMNVVPPLRAAQGTLVEGPGSGRDDLVPAQLSPGEYIMDAETVALLGDGSNDEGARRLDEMRKRLRAHKGKGLAKGKFSSNAKRPEQYIEGK
jgi:hypothetical protein